MSHIQGDDFPVYQTKIRQILEFRRQQMSPRTEFRMLLATTVTNVKC